MTENPVPALGDIIEAHCTHCRLNLDCNVAAVVEGAVKQVQCRTCGNFVAHKPPVDMAQRKQEQIRRLMKMQAKKRGKSDSSSASSASSAASVTDERWESLTDGVLSWHARPYDRHRGYKSGDFILHKAHGMGYVESADEAEVIVLFRSGLENLPHGEPVDE